MTPLTAPCPRCVRPCAEFSSPAPGRWFACDNCERGDDGGYDIQASRALGPLTFTLDESADAELERRFPTDPPSPADYWDDGAPRPSCDLNQSNPED